MDMISFSYICRNCGQYLEYHNQKELEKCKAITKEKKENLDYYT
tara:strand:- start:42 stop:173 length:132 start_codon:yes stop_codon:yes gene_type:complete